LVSLGGGHVGNHLDRGVRGLVVSYDPARVLPGTVPACGGCGSGRWHRGIIKSGRFTGGALALLGEAFACRCSAHAVWLALGGSLLLGATALVISPWIYRNFVCLSRFVPIRSNFGIEFAVGNHPENRDGTTYGVRGMAFHPSLNAVEAKKLKAMREVAYNRMKLRETWASIQTHPGRFAKLTTRRLVLVPVRQCGLGSAIVRPGTDEVGGGRDRHSAGLRRAG
jgi:hypothetical protein